VCLFCSALIVSVWNNFGTQQDFNTYLITEIQCTKVCTWKDSVKLFITMSSVFFTPFPSLPLCNPISVAAHAHDNGHVGMSEPLGKYACVLSVWGVLVSKNFSIERMHTVFWI
jgi:hypothetical protein